MRADPFDVLTRAARPVGPGPSGPRGARPSRPAPRALCQLRLRPVHAATPDPRSVRRAAAEREEALRAAHALGAELVLDALVRAEGSVALYLGFPLERRGQLLPILAPRLRPWGWEEERFRPPPEAWEAPWVGRLGAGERVDGARPWRSHLSERDLPPWVVLLPALRADGCNIWFRWIARPVGPSSRALLPARPAVPRSDSTTPMPIAPSHALSRDVEDLRGERSAGPYWSCGGAIVLWTDAGRSAGRGRALAQTLPGLLGALTSGPAGSHLGVRWARTGRGRRKVLAHALAGRPPGPPLGWLAWSGRPPLLAPPEVQPWLPPWDARWTAGLRATPGPGSFGVLLGHDEAGGAVHLPVPTSEGHHLVVAGETGMGKSSLLQGLAAGFAARGAALVVVDPLGETAEGLLPHLPPASLGRTVWVSPLRSPVGVNALALPVELDPSRVRAERERRVSELVTALRHVRSERYGETVFWGPRIEDLLTRTFLLLSTCPGASLRMAAELLMEPETWTAPFPDPDQGGREALHLWETIRSEGPEERQGALRVVQEVALSSAISRLLSPEEPRFSLERALEPGAVTCFSLERAEVGVRPASYVAAALLSLLWSHVVARPARSKVVLLLDEVQEYATGALVEVLQLGRRYNVHVLAATQSLSALAPGLRDALVTNARDLIFFRGSPADARMVRETVGPEPAGDLPSLERGQALALLGKGREVLTVRVAPLPPVVGGQATAARLRDARIEASRRYWGTATLPSLPNDRGDPSKEGRPAPTRAPGEGGRPGPTVAAAPPLGREDPADPPVIPIAAPPDAGRSVSLGSGLPDGAGPPVLGPRTGSGPVRGPDAANPPTGDDLALWALLVGALEAPEGEPFPVPVARARRLCGEDERALRRLGARLKGNGTLLRTERREGERVWFLLREGLLELLPGPWAPELLARARSRWEESRGNRAMFIVHGS